jgi:signal transduction histidine kinase
MVRTVKIGRTLDQTSLRVLRPHPTVRWRLTLLYSVLFLICGAALLAITYEFFTKFAFSYPPKAAGPNGSPANSSLAALDAALGRVRTAYLHRLLVGSGIALGIMALVSGVLGWVVAGRVLAPLRTITATTERISATDLHERLVLPGPRDELRLLADTIDRLLERLEAAFDTQRRFVANASHELRTPLTTMRTVLDVAIAKPNAPPQLKSVDTNLRQALDQADRLLENFLALARAQHGQLDHAPVALEQLASDALARRDEAIAAKHIELRTSLTSVRVTGSETLLARMVDNVIENAVRHNQPYGSITVALEPHHEQARLVVESGGPILDHSTVAQLAEPFKRLGAERTGSENGHGLGLSIVAAVAAAHDGTLELQPRPQGGLRVQITLPIAAVAQPASATA